MKARLAVSSFRGFEDFRAGLTFRSGRAITLTAGEIASFAAEFDPRPPHLAGVAASPWQVAAVAMRLLVDSDLGLCGQAAGLAIEAMRCRLPVGAGDSLRLEGAVTETRPSRSRLDRGIVKFRVTVFNQRNEAVLEATHVVMVARRSVLPSVS